MYDNTPILYLMADENGVNFETETHHVRNAKHTTHHQQPDHRISAHNANRFHQQYPLLPAWCFGCQLQLGPAWGTDHYNFG